MPLVSEKEEIMYLLYGQIPNRERLRSLLEQVPITRPNSAELRMLVGAAEAPTTLRLQLAETIPYTYYGKTPASGISLLI